MLIFSLIGVTPGPLRRSNVLVDNHPENVKAAVDLVKNGEIVGVAGEIPLLYFSLFILREGLKILVTNEMGMPIFQMYDTAEEAREAMGEQGLSEGYDDFGGAEESGGDVGVLEDPLSWKQRGVDSTMSLDEWARKNLGGES